MTEIRADVLVVQLLPFAANRSEPPSQKVPNLARLFARQFLQPTTIPDGVACSLCNQHTSSPSMVPYLKVMTNHLTIMSCWDVG